ARVRRACSRSSAATVCRLFFTRWWISRIVASLVISSRSRCRSSVTSRTSTRAPVRMPFTTSGRDLSWTTEPLPSISVSRGERPLGGTRGGAPAGARVGPGWGGRGPGSGPAGAGGRAGLAWADRGVGGAFPPRAGPAEPQQAVADPGGPDQGRLLARVGEGA